MAPSRAATVRSRTSARERRRRVYGALVSPRVPDEEEVRRALGRASRIEALRRSALLDTPVEEPFERLVRLAATLLSAPIALVSIVEEARQFFKSGLGVPEPWGSRRESPLAYSFCQYVVALGEPFVVEDARRHPVLRDTLAVRELGIAAYLGVPITTSEGDVLGSFCVADGRPRSWRDLERDAMVDLTASVVSEIELRAIALHARDTLEQDRRRALELNDALVQRLAVAKLALDLGRDDHAAAELDGALGSARQLVTELLQRAGSATPGGMRRGGPGSAR
jgi:GAF domain-containing protein